MPSEEKLTIFNFDKPPILLIGSGITRRYLKNSPDWKGLLQIIANRMEINEGRLVAFRHTARHNCIPEIGEYPRLATELNLYLNEEIKSGRIDPQRLFNEKEYDLFIKGINPIKIIASSALEDLEMTDDESLLDEINIFKKLVDIIPCIVTTNYDCLIEDAIFERKFAVYSRVSDYYLSGSQGIGEIFKIHGTLKEPSTIIINEEDYQEFRDRSKIVSAKLLSTLCDYPMVILGYQLNDGDVKDIINDLISSLDEDKFHEIEKNVIYISYMPGELGFIKTTTNFDYKGKRLAISSLSTDNFKAIFQELSEMIPSASPSKIRKLRQLVKKIIVVGSSAESKYGLIGIDDISPEKYDKLVVAITDENYLRALKEIPIFTSDSMVNSVLSGDSEYDSKAVVKYFQDSKRTRKSEYAPIFHYLRESGMPKEDYGPYLTEYIEEKKKQYRDKLENYIPSTFRSVIRSINVKSLDDVDRAISSVAEYAKPLLIMYYYQQEAISEEEALIMLRRISDEWKSRPESELTGNCRSNFKCAITYLAFKEMGLEN
ncbi:MAG: SIR2 family protein [Methanomassiliicoccus sp.]|nr:SIR2 family protein [Methanomassiliicoccus sp.]